LSHAHLLVTCSEDPCDYCICLPTVTPDTYVYGCRLFFVCMHVVRKQIPGCSDWMIVSSPDPQLYQQDD